MIVLKYEVNLESNAEMLQVSGTLTEVTAEATYLIHRLYSDIAADKKAAQEFKRLIQAAIGREDSPVWEVGA